MLSVRGKALHIPLVVNKWHDQSTEMENIDAGYWDISIPDYQYNSTRSVINLNGTQTVILSSFDDYQVQGARALNFEGEDISSKIIAKGFPVNHNSGDFIITYTLTDTKGRQAISV